MFSFSGLTTIGVKRPAENRCKVSWPPGRGDIGRVATVSSQERRGEGVEPKAERDGAADFTASKKMGSDDECLRWCI